MTQAPIISRGSRGRRDDTPDRVPPGRYVSDEVTVDIHCVTKWSHNHGDPWREQRYRGD